MFIRDDEDADHAALGAGACRRVRRLDELMPLVIVALRRIARSFMRHQRPGHTFQPTALINEAFIRLFGDETPAFAIAHLCLRSRHG